MMNKKMWGGETRPNYVAPSFEEFNVAVEEGFAASDPFAPETSLQSFGSNGWQAYGDDGECILSE